MSHILVVNVMATEKGKGWLRAGLFMLNAGRIEG